jgi:IS30 family transposase
VEASQAVKMTRKDRQLIGRKIRKQWSPKQISGWFDRHQVVSISHERIYQHGWGDKCRGGGLWKHLRQSSKEYKKRRGGRDRRGQIPNRVSIDQRSHTLELRRRFGDWEGDTIVGKGHRGALITLVERKSKYLLMKQVDQYTSEKVREGIEALISQDELPFKSLTVDNGREFACHE